MNAPHEAHYVFSKPISAADGPLKVVPERILARIDAQYCIFGHTHKPLRMGVEGGGVYLNTGTWLPSGKPGLLRAFTHVMIRHGATGASAELMQWRDGASRPFTDGGCLSKTSAAYSAERADETSPSVSAEAR